MSSLEASFPRCRNTPALNRSRCLRERSMCPAVASGHRSISSANWPSSSSMMDGMTGETKGPFRVNALEDLKALVGEELAVTNYRQVTQEQVIRFAEATGDTQWIHVDVERARRESPYAGTIAHGFLTLSLLAPLMGEAVAFACPLKLAVNYGLDRVRIPAPGLVGPRIRPPVVL